MNFELFFFFRFSGFLFFGGGNDLFLGELGNLFVVGEFHAEDGAPLGHGAEVGGVGEDLGQGGLGLHHPQIAVNVHPLHAAAAAVEVAHDVPAEFLGARYFHVEDGLQDGGAGHGEGLLEAHAAGDLKGPVGGVHGMELAVHEADLEVHHGIAGQHALDGCGLDALVHGGAEILRDGAAEDLVYEFVPLAPPGGFQDDGGLGELPAAARLLFMPVGGLGLARHGLLKRDLGKLEVDAHAVFVLELLDHDLDMKLARAGEDDLLGLHVAGELQHRVLFHEARQGRGDLVFVALALGLNGEGDGGLGDLERFVQDGFALLADRVEGLGFLQLGQGHDVAGLGLPHGGQGLALDGVDGAEALGGLVVGVVIGSVGMKSAADDLEDGDTAREQVRDGLDDVGAGGGVFFGLEGQGLARDGVLSLPGAHRRRGHQVHDEIQQGRQANELGRGGEEDGDDVALGDPLFQPGQHILGGEGPGLEEFFHELFVALGHLLHKLFKRGIRPGLHVRGDLGFLRTRGAVAGGEERLAADQVHHAVESRFLPDGNLDGEDPIAEFLLQLRHNLLIIGIILVHLVDDDAGRDPLLFAQGEDLAGVHLHARDAVDHDGQGVRPLQAGEGFRNEHGEAGGVEEIHLVALPFRVGQAELDGDLALNLLLVEIRDGVAVLNAKEPVHGPGGEQQARYQGGFAGVVMPRKGEIPQGVRGITFHGRLLGEN